MTTTLCHTDEEHARLGREQTLLDRISELERRCADKDASIQQLIEQLQKAEAQNAGLETTVRRYMEAYGLNDEVPDRTAAKPECGVTTTTISGVSVCHLPKHHHEPHRTW